MDVVKLTSCFPSLLQPYGYGNDRWNPKTKPMTTGYCKIPPSLQIGSRLVFRCALSSNDPVVVDDVSLYSEMIQDLVEDGLFEDAIAAYIQMLENGAPVEEFRMFPRLIKAFGAFGDVETATQIHAHVLKLGKLMYISVANSILGMYWKCRAASNAVQVFDKMLQRDLVTWNTMISGFCHTGDYIASLNFFRDMIQEPGLVPNRVACLSVLSSCASIGNLMLGQEIHGYLLRHDIFLDEFLVTGLIDMYMKCGNVRNAERVFSTIFCNEKNSAVWNAMILGYVSNRCSDKALGMLIDMIDSGTRLESSTMVAALVLCSHSSDSIIGEQIHGLVCRFGMENDVRVRTALIDMYFKCGNPNASEKMFRSCLDSNFVMWGTVVSNYVQSGYMTEGLELCHRFIKVHGFADSIVLLAALRACSSLILKEKTMEFHGLAIKLGLASDVFVGGALVDVHAKCRDIESAEKVFYRLSGRDLVSWNAMISGYAQNGEFMDEALEAVRDMVSVSIRPNPVTVASILSICAQVSAMIPCREVHGYVLRQGMESNVLVNNSLIATYARCGDLNNALVIFDNMGEKNPISWNSMILGLGMHGRANEMFVLFEKMRLSGMVPDHATFTALLSACSHSGKVDRGWKYFTSMLEDYNLEPELEQYSCMVDLLGRAGHLEESYELVTSMPYAPDDRIWGSLLGSCKNHGNERLAEVVSNRILELDPDSVGYRVVLANLYEDYGKWNEADRVRSEIRDRGLRKSPGCSWIEVNSSTHSFSAGDWSHRQSEEIYGVLESLTAEIRRGGYVPQLNRQDLMSS